MVDKPTKEGLLPFYVESLSKECATYYGVFGEPSTSSHPPLLVLHGGPGASHDYLLGLADLWTEHSIPVIFYDQIGNGRSTHLPETKGDKTFWKEELFMAELSNLIDRLGLRQTGFSLFGQSWGGMLGTSYAITRPQGLKKLILANTPADLALWTRGIQMLRSTLPQDMQQSIKACEETDDFENPAYLEAVEVFYKKHLCNIDPYPAPELQSALKWMTEDPTVYSTMHGPSELTHTGSLAGWSVLGRLKDIQVPTLVYNGSEDEATDVCVEPLFWEIPRVKWVTVDGATHLTHVEKKDRIIRLVSGFLTHE